MGRLAKNDRIDAALIARFTAELPTREPRHDPLIEQMAELAAALPVESVPVVADLSTVEGLATVVAASAHRLRAPAPSLLVLAGHAGNVRADCTVAAAT